MCDFSYLKECVKSAKDLTNKELQRDVKEQLDIIFSAIDSQIVSLENYIENESRKKVIALEKVQELESELISERERRKQLEASGAKLSDEQLNSEEQRRRRLALAHEAKLISQELLHIAIELRHINKKVTASNSKSHLEHIEKVWESTKIKQIVPSSLVISLETTSSLQDAIDIGSVVMAVYGPDEEVLGLITIADIIGYCELTIGPEDLEKELMELSDPETAQYSGYAAIPITSVLESTSIPYFPLFLNAPISSLISVFNKGIPYIPICEEDHMIINIVSQSFLVQILSTHLKVMETAIVGTSKTLKELDLLEKTRIRVITIRDDAKAIDALLLMGSLKRDAIAVVDEHDVIVASLKLSDFKGITCRELPKLFLKIPEFIAEKEVMIPILANKTHNLKYLTTMFIQHKPEHVWLVNKHKKPVGLVYLTDIMNLLDIDWEGVGWKSEE